MKRGTAIRRTLPLILATLVALPLVTGVKHVDIFQQFEDGNHRENQNGRHLDELEDEDDAIRTEQPTSCVEEVLPSEPLELHEKLLKEIEPPTVALQNLSPPAVGEMLRKLTGSLFGTNLRRIGENVRNVIGEMRDKIGAYVKDTVAKFEQQRYRAMGAVRQKIDQLNARIRQHFESELVEYKDVCLPDADTCMRQLHAHIEQYEQRLQSNVEACQDRLAEELARQRQKVDEAQRLMDGPYRKMDRCLDQQAGFGRSFLACTGSAVANLGKALTQGLRSFTNTMTKLSGGLERRVDKFDKCVVERRRLLQQNERQVTASVKGCFERKRSQPENFF